VGDATWADGAAFVGGGVERRDLLRVRRRTARRGPELREAATDPSVFHPPAPASQLDPSRYRGPGARVLLIGGARTPTTRASSVAPSTEMP
jgi:hypothetical protein